MGDTAPGARCEAPGPGPDRAGAGDEGWTGAGPGPPHAQVAAATTIAGKSVRERDAVENAVRLTWMAIGVPRYNRLTLRPVEMEFNREADAV